MSTVRPFAERVCAMVMAVAVVALAGCHTSQQPTKKEARQQIISLSPGVTEILYGIGAFSSLIADSEYCDFPEEAKQLPHIGGFFDANLEAVATMKPDLIILIEDQAILFRDRLQQMGLRVVVVKTRSVTDILESIQTLGLETGHQAEAGRLADEVRGRLDERIEQTAGLPRLRVLCVISHLPGALKDIYTASAGSFLDELITASGGQNIAPPGGRGYSKMQQEALVDVNPQVIIDTVHRPSAERAGDPRAVWQALPQIDAVKSGRVVIVTESFVAHPSQRIVETLDVLSRIIHPEVFGRYDQ